MKKKAAVEMLGISSDMLSDQEVSTMILSGHFSGHFKRVSDDLDTVSLCLCAMKLGTPVMVAEGISEFVVNGHKVRVEWPLTAPKITINGEEVSV